MIVRFWKKWLKLGELDRVTNLLELTQVIEERFNNINKLESKELDTATKLRLKADLLNSYFLDLEYAVRDDENETNKKRNSDLRKSIKGTNKTRNA